MNRVDVGSLAIWCLSIVICAGGGAAASEPSPPASFSCERAGKLDEQIICSDPLLRAADAALGRQFTQLLTDTAPSARREAIRADEHDWILRRNQECGVAGTAKITEPDRPFRVDCFLAAYEEREVDLESIGREPDKEPAAISMPIRRSLFSDAGAPAGAVRFTETGIGSIEAEHPVFAWQRDGGLLILGRDLSRNTVGLFRWRADAPPALVSDAVADPDRIERLCLADSEELLIPRAAGDPPPPLQLIGGGAVRLISWTNIPAALALRCGISARRRLAIGEEGAVALDLGPLGPVKEFDDRFVRLRRDDTVRETNPPIRIDRRLAPDARYLAAGGEFVIGPTRRPASEEPMLERIWAKTDCLGFWRVAASDGTATPGCIPYGAYVGELPTPLPTKGGLFFAVGEAGLYKVEGDAARQVLPGPVEAAIVSPDGCAIAFARAPRQSRGRMIAVFDACKA